MRFGASCCPTWDPSNWFSRKLPSLMSFWMNKSRQNENQKLLRTASEEEVFKKRPKRKVKKRRKSADDLASSVATEDVTSEQKTQDSNTESSVSESVKPRKRRSRREQAALAAKSSRGGKSGYTAANLRRYAAERKPTTDKAGTVELNLENTRSQSTSAIKRAEKGT